MNKDRRPITASCKFRTQTDRDPRPEPRWLVRQDMALETGRLLHAALWSSKPTRSLRAIDELSDNETYGHQIHVADERPRRLPRAPPP